MKSRTIQTSADVGVVDVEVEITDAVVDQLLAERFAGVQSLFERYGPSSERNCDWFRSTEEPWAGLAVVLGAK